MKIKIWLISITIILAALFAVSSVIKEQRIRKKQCEKNLVLLEKAKGSFGAQYGAGLGSEISLKVLDSYAGGVLFKLSCPSGGEYKINPVGQPVTCSHHSR